MGAIRTVIVEPPSGAREGLAVLRGALYIVFFTALTIALARPGPSAREGGAPAAAAANRLTVDQRPFQELDAEERRLFLLAQEGLVEAENLRSQSGAWPDAAALAADGIPPFTPDPLDRVGYSWTSRVSQQGRTVNYLGIPPVGANRMSFVVLILEPEPGVPHDPNQPLDELHHRLADGTVLHVSTWMGPGTVDGDAATARLPVERGWRQIVTQP